MNAISPDNSSHIRTFETLKVGETARLSHVVAQRDFDLFEAAIGGLRDIPVHLRASEPDPTLVQPNWVAGIVSVLIGTKLPGPGSSILRQDLHFISPPEIAGIINASITLSSRNEATTSITFECLCTDQNDLTILTGSVEVLPPKVGFLQSTTAVPRIRVERHDRLRSIIARAGNDSPVPTAVVMPVDAAALHGALDASRAGLIVPILIGPTDIIGSIAKLGNIDISNCRLVDAQNGAAAAARAVEMVHAGEVGLIMKGDLHTDVLMHPVIASTTGLRTTRRISHVFVIDVPDYERLLLVTDAAINIIPTLVEKVDIVQNAIHLAHLLGVAMPRVAILSAVELVNDRIPSTLDAAALCKMADRGQITGGPLDGPLAFDNAINEAAAREKGIVSPVAGRADIVVVPDLEAGNMLAKQLTFLAGAEAAGVVIGASVPIILTSRADSAGARLASCAVAVLMARSGAFT